jgi:hypothetical protein
MEALKKERGRRTEYRCEALLKVSGDSIDLIWRKGNISQRKSIPARKKMVQKTCVLHTIVHLRIDYVATNLS